MALTPRDKKFLLNLKDKGYSSDDAFKALQTAKARIKLNEDVKKSETLKSSPASGSDIAQVGKFSVSPTDLIAKAKGMQASEEAGPAVSRVIQDVQNLKEQQVDPSLGTQAKRLAEGVALAPVNIAVGAGKGLANEAAKGVEWGAEAVGAEGLAERISKGRSDWLTPKGNAQKLGSFMSSAMPQMQSGVLKSIGETATGVGELGARAVGQGEVADSMGEWSDKVFAPTSGMQKVGKVGGDIAQYVIPGVGATKAASIANKGAQVLSTAQKAKNLGKIAALEGAVFGGVTAAKEGELNSKVAWDAALGTAFPLVAGGVGGMAKYFMKPKAAKELIKESSRVNEAMEQAKNLGVEDRQISFIMKDLTPANKGAAVEIFENAVQGTKNLEQPNAFVVAGKYLDDYVSRAEKLLSEEGKLLGKAKEPLKTLTISPRPIKQEVQNLMKNLGVKFNEKGVPNFELSKIRYSGQAKTLLDDVLNFTKKNSINAGDLENVTDQIDQISGLMTTSGVKSSDPGVRALTKAKTAINQVLNNADKNFGAQNKKYAQLINLIERVKYGSDVKLSKGDKVFAGDVALRRLTGNAGTKQKQALEAIKELEVKFGIKAPLDFRQLALTADIAEKATGQVNPGSLAGVTKLGQRAREVPVLGGALKAKDFLKDIVSAFKSTQDATLRANLLDELAKATPPDILDEATKVALTQLPAESIDKVVALAIGSLFGAGLSGVQESVSEEIIDQPGEPQ